MQRRALMEDNHTEQEAPKDTQTQEETGSDWTLDSALTEIKKLREEAKSNRIARKEAEEKLETTTAKLTEFESSVKEYEAKLESFKDYDEIKTSLDSLRQENKTLGYKAALAGKVIDTDKAIKLIDEDDFDEGQNLNVDKFLERNPFLAAKGTVTNPASNKVNTKNPNSTEDLTKLSPAELEKFFSEYKPAR
jgi:DNA repair exonuclease SbcCD ATPase subunit